MQFPYKNHTDEAYRTHGVPVLCIGYVAETFDERCSHLGQSGYRVHPARSRREAENLLRQMPFAALVIGHAIPEADRLEFIRMARALNPQAIVVLLYRDSIRRAEAAQAVLCVENGPTSLVNTLRELLGT